MDTNKHELLEQCRANLQTIANLTDDSTVLALVQDTADKLAEAATGMGPEHEKVEAIQDLICRRFELPRAALLSRSRRAYLIWPRFLAIHFSYLCTSLVQQQLMPLFNRKDHSLVGYATEAVRERVETNLKARNEYEQVDAAIKRLLEPPKAENLTGDNRENREGSSLLPSFPSVKNSGSPFPLLPPVKSFPK